MYIITVQAVVITKILDNTTNISQDVVHNSLPATLKVNTSPQAPHSLRLVKVSYSNASITWSAPLIGNGEKIMEYLVKYQIMDVNGSSSVQGTEKIQSALYHFLMKGMEKSFFLVVQVVLVGSFVYQRNAPLG